MASSISPRHAAQLYKVFFFGATDAYMQPQQQWAWNQSAVSKAPPMFLLDDAPPVVAEQIARTKI
jgi:hypothetical protein